MWGLLLFWVMLGLPYSAYAAPHEASPIAVPAAQSNGMGGQIEPPLLAPWEATTVKLLTHTADFTLLFGDSPSTAADIMLALDATYRLENDSDGPMTVNVKIAEPNEEDGFHEVTLSVDGTPVSLYQTTGVGYAAQFQIRADARTDVRLAYQLNLAATALPLLSYQAADLAAWPGNPSLRVSVTVPDQITPESWLQIAPEGWHYATTDRPGETSIKWLYDAQVPRTPFLFEFIHPNQWAQLQQLTEQAAVDARGYLPLGNQYRTLLDATPVTAEYRAVRERFYAQALAAYLAGIDALSNSEDRGKLYTALAGLYRYQVAQPDGVVHADYAVAMVGAAQRALALLPAADPQRQELVQWLENGLQIELANAQEQEDWAAALDIVEQLSALPPEWVNADMLEQTKRSIIVRQALQLLEQENRAGAVALAGDDLLNSALTPAPTQLPLFRRWEISTTVSPTTMALLIAPFEIEGRAAEALSTLDELVATLQAAADGSIGVEWQQREGNDTERELGQLVITAPTDVSFASLTTAIPPVPQWALLYTLLRQLQPTVESQAALFKRTTQLHLLMDLQTAGETWRTVAAELEITATTLEAEAATRNPRNADEAENALQLRIQAANYRAAAHAWQALRQDSWVATRFVVPSGLQENTRTWITTVASPASTLSLQSAPSYAASFMGLVILAVGTLLLLSGLLWWLL